MDIKEIEKHIRGLLVAIGEDPDREGLRETPARVARMYEEAFEGIKYTNREIAEMFGKTFEVPSDPNSDGAVVIKDISVFSYCEHHMALMYDMKVDVAYVPCGRVLGLSKIARICDMKSYFDENMKLLDNDNLDALFNPSPIYTKIRDDNPTRYIGRSRVKNSMVADGCVIEGEIENCVLFRGVKVGRGSVVKNCILMQDTTIMNNVEMEYVITDKEVTISTGKELKGNDTFPVFIPAYKEI